MISKNVISYVIVFSIYFYCVWLLFFFFFSSRRRHTRFDCDWSSDVCSSDLNAVLGAAIFVPGADFPVLTLNQLRLVLRLAQAHGEEIDAQRVPEILAVVGRSEERRVGKECRSRWWPEH